MDWIKIYVLWIRIKFNDFDKKVVLGLNGCEESDDCLKAVFFSGKILNKWFSIFFLSH
jgi:hypothetical protein